MKKIALIISMLMLIFALTACGGSKQSEEPAEDTTVTEETAEEAADVLAGTTYVLTSSTTNGETITEFEYPETYKFGTDGTVTLDTEAFNDETMESYMATYSGTYTVDGDTATITVDINDGHPSLEYTIEGDTITWKAMLKDPDGNDVERIMVYTKQ